MKEIAVVSKGLSVFAIVSLMVLVAVSGLPAKSCVVLASGWALCQVSP